MIIFYYIKHDLVKQKTILKYNLDEFENFLIYKLDHFFYLY